jgi:hypothetical protein
MFLIDFKFFKLIQVNNVYFKLIIKQNLALDDGDDDIKEIQIFFSYSKDNVQFLKIICLKKFICFQLEFLCVIRCSLLTFIRINCVEES